MTYERAAKLEFPQDAIAEAALLQIRAHLKANRLSQASTLGQELLGNANHVSPAAMLEVLLTLGSVAKAQHKAEAAFGHIFAALRVAEDSGDLIGQSRARSLHARVLNGLGQAGEAASESYVALRLAGGDVYSKIHALGALSDAQQGLAEPSAGLRTCEEMLQLAQQLGDPELQAWAHRGACGAHLLEHQLVKTTDGCSEPACAQLELAKRHAAASVELSEVAECVNGVLLGHYLHANVLIRLGDRPGARRELAEMLNSAGSEARLYRSLALQTRAHIDQLEGDFEESLKSAREALSIDESIGSTRGVMNCCGELADILEAAGDFKGALSWHRRFHSSYKHFASESARAQAAALAIKEDLARSKAMAEAAGACADLLERSNSVLVLGAAHLTRTALEDGLTGVSNRRRFDQELEALVRDHVGRQRCSIALLDVDHFKGVNDRFSHVVGDEVLRQISRIMQRTSRATDIVARYGGEEFAILFVNLAPEEAVLACERVRQSVRDADWSELHPDLRVTVSLGLVHFNERDVDKMSYLKLVDERLYHAKSSGRNRVVGPAQAEGNAITAEPERFRSQMPATVYK